MKAVTTIGAQGDCLFRKVLHVPDRSKEWGQRGPLVVAHSETGHHHSIDEADGVRLFQDPNDPLVCYLVLEGVEYADVVHHRAFDTHETLRLLATPREVTVFEVRRQREYRDEPARGTAWTAVQD